MRASRGRATVPDDGRSRDTFLLSVEGRGQSPGMAVARNGVFDFRLGLYTRSRRGWRFSFSLLSPFILSPFYCTTVLTVAVTIAVTMLILTVAYTYSCCTYS